MVHNPIVKEEELDNAMEELKAWRRKYGSIPQFRQVVEAVNHFMVTWSANHLLASIEQDLNRKDEQALETLKKLQQRIQKIT